MAEIKKRGSVWQARIFYTDSSGKRHSISKSGFTRKAQAQAWADEASVKKNRGALLDKSSITLPDYFRQWIETYKAGKNTRITESRYETFAKLLDENFSGQQLSQVSSQDWQRFLNSYGDTHARETVSKLNGYVRAMVKNAINDQITYTDFTLNAYITGAKGKKESEKYLEEDDFKLLTEAAFSTADINHITRAAIYVGAMTGARYSEIMALTFDDIDFKNNKITIDKSWDAVYSHAAKDTKTASSVRTIDVIPRVTELIKKLKKERLEFEMRTGHRDDSNMIFKTVRGQVPTNNAANKALRKLQAHLGIDNPITFHGLRHSHASFLLSRGVDIYYISKRLGHANVSITLNVYSHLLNSASERQANKSLEALESI